ncbi:MAG: hypothetical protein RBR15_05200 [Sphaerochaeta sp.]|nr:hypothetical protein [Sphaerochaeta sp.]
MKRTIAILLILVLALFGLFAAAEDAQGPATVIVNSSVSDFSAFGVTSGLIANTGAFNSIAKFKGAVSSSVDTTIAMLDLKAPVLVGYLSGINNTKAAVLLAISVGALSSDNGVVELTVTPQGQTIPASPVNTFGTLKDVPIRIKEKSPGSAALAPAGTYLATITIALTTVV